ncbi:hypothetical protein PRIPAC_97258 [Pristionchus pacificus]|uniref:Uncharacterized protein n=1 Tax=Pristionchus pacificus TaxID=54126 RepID=A0A2A6D1P0_PRIPA|nr:hypothetical protein PRIPAC_97258 [Pristionchus pacificus]|eukprot:PDM84221.1 hypothetical protein PRIPAC_33244 [Pristionchus pacificus]
MDASFSTPSCLDHTGQDCISSYHADSLKLALVHTTSSMQGLAAAPDITIMAPAARKTGKLPLDEVIHLMIDYLNTCIRKAKRSLRQRGISVSTIDSNGLPAFVAHIMLTIALLKSSNCARATVHLSISPVVRLI